jgi:hypothetical protein
MDSTILLLVVVVVLLAIVGWLAYDRRRSDSLRSRFGPEYKRTVEQVGDRREAESELAERERRVSALQIRPLPAGDRERYDADWRRVQARFVDEPPAAIAEADRLIGEVMERRGYPVGDFKQRVADISVDHPTVVEHYRAAHDIAERDARLPEDTETLRQAMVHYRALFVDLLDNPADGNPTQVPAQARVEDRELTRNAS